jgi:hypothetical protein
MNEKRLFDSVVTLEDWRGIIEKQKDLALQGNIVAVNFLFNRRFGVPTQKQKNTKSKQVKIEFNYES